MITAIPLDKNGNQSGPPREFQDEHWNRLTLAYGKKLRWIAQEPPPKETPKPRRKRINIID